MSSDFAMQVRHLSKCFHIYDQPRHRLLQMLMPGDRKYHREFWALRDVSFEIKRGETVAIIGRNGSGKSTLLQMLCGTLAPTSGNVEINGRIAALLELGAGFNPEFSGRENVFVNAALLGMDENETALKLSSIEDFAEIGQFIDQPVKTYSSGMYVRLAFAVAVHANPQILIVDEALAVGDARFQAKCLKRIKEMKEQGVSILFVSHDVGAVRTLCDRAIWLDAGNMRKQGPVFPVTAEYTEHIYAVSTAESDHRSVLSSNEVVELGEDGVEKARPINHWGTHIGTIVSTSLCDLNGAQKSVFVDRELLLISVCFKPPQEAMRNKLSVSISIKDLAGTDLIVLSTWNDESIRFLEEGKTFKVCFRFDNCLNNGEYLLAVAIEDRSASTIQYYEYVEGAQYFSTVFHGNRHGRFMPSAAVTVQAEHKAGGSK